MTQSEWMERFHAATGIGALKSTEAFALFLKWKAKQMRKPKGKKR